MRNLGNRIEALVEEVDKLREYRRAMIRGNSNFEPDRLLNIANLVGLIANECKSLYANYVTREKVDICVFCYCFHESQSQKKKLK